MRLEELKNRPHFVYRAYDSKGRLLYIGCSLNVRNRMRDHKMWASWYDQMTHHAIDGPHSYDKARRLEWEAICNEGSLYNAQGKLYREWSSMTSRFFNEVLGTAVANGEPIMSAIRQANAAQRAEMPTYDEHLALLGLRSVA